jgi:hypothetical protein
MKTFILTLMTSLIYASGASANELEQRTTLADQSSVAVTIYNNDLALIKDQRQLTLKKGLNYLAFRGVSANIRPETALIRSLDANIDLQILEQNFDFDLLTPQKLLEKYTGKTVEISSINPATGKVTVERARVLSTNNGVTVKIGNKIISNPTGDYIFDNVPDNLRDQPTLVTQLVSSSNKQQTLELGYLTRGLSWKADYVAELSHADQQLDLTGWITLVNQSGTAYNNAKLQLVAGNVNQIRQPLPRKRQYLVQEDSMLSMAAEAMAEESLFEYHLYSLGRKTNLADKQSKQVALLSATSKPVKKQLLLQGKSYYYNNQYPQLANTMKVAVYIEFSNTKQANLGLPMPKGIVRVYKNDRQGNAQFVGEDSIDHTPKNGDVRLKLGESFDVTADKKQVAFRKVANKKPYNNTYESEYRIELKNAKPESVTVTVREPIPGDWEMLNESQPHKKISSGMADWLVTVPAESTVILEYQVLTRL